MITYIPEETYKHLELAEGEQVRINHTECTAGSDTRKRLYIKNKGSHIVAYCHNCGLKGGKRNSVSVHDVRKNRQERSTLTEPALVGKVQQILKDTYWGPIQESEVLSASKDILGWLLDRSLLSLEKREMLSNTVTLPSIPTTESENILAIPLYNSNLVSYGTTLKVFRGGKVSDILAVPKKLGSYHVPSTHSRPNGLSDCRTLVITEDALSAAVAAEALTVGYCAPVGVALLGTVLTGSLLKRLHYTYRDEHMRAEVRIYLALDGDKAGIDAALKIMPVLRAGGFECRMLTVRGDPDIKSWSYQDIRNRIQAIGA